MSRGRLHKPLYGVLVLGIGLTGCGPKGDALYRRAEQSLERGDVRAAVIDVKNLLQDEPQNAQARALLGKAFVAGGELDAAAIELQRAKDFGAPRVLTLVPECQLLAANGEFDRVLAECDPESASSAAKVDLQIAFGHALLGLMRDTEAMEHFQAALAVRPDSVVALLGLAEAIATTEGLPAARAIMNQAHSAARDQAQYWIAVGQLSDEADDLAGAEQAYVHADELARTKPEASRRIAPLAALADVQLRRGKVKEAVATGDELMKVAPDDPLVKQLRGQIAAADGRFDDARMLLEQAVAAMPESQEARVLLGMANVELGNLGQAEMQFSTVVARQPDDLRTQRLLAEVRARLGSRGMALEPLQSVAARGEEKPLLLAMNGQLGLAVLSHVSAAAAPGEVHSQELHFAVASGHLVAGDLDTALDILEKSAAGSADDLQREFVSMIELLRIGERQAAFSQAEAVLKNFGGNPAVRNMVGGIYAAGGRRDLSRKQFDVALELAPQDAYAQVNIGRLELAAGRPSEAERIFRKLVQGDPRNLLATLGVAVAAGAQGRPEEAEKWLRKASADYPESVEVQLVAARLYLAAGDLGKARTAIDGAARRAPGDAAVSNARGILLVAAQDLPGALASFQKAAAGDTKAHGFALNLARAHLLNRDLAAALSVLDGVLKAEPGFVPALALASTSTLQAGQLGKSTGYAARLRQAAPSASITHWVEGDLAMSQKRYRDALEHYRRASANGSNAVLAVKQYWASRLAGEAHSHKVLEDWLAANAHDVGVITVLADDRKRRGDIDGAIGLYESALDALPDNVVMLNNLALLYQDKGDPRAVDLAAHAHALAPGSPAVQDTFGWLLVETGSLDRGLRLLRDAVRRLPDNAEVQYHYGVALAKKGNETEASQVLRKALGGPLSPGARVGAQRLQQQLSQ